MVDVLLRDDAPGGCGAIVAQEYVDHGGIVLKGYTVGDLRHVATRPSLPDIGQRHAREQAAAAHAPGGEGGEEEQAAATDAHDDESPPAVVHIDSQRPLDEALACALRGGGGTLAPAAAAALAVADDGVLGRRREVEDTLAAVQAHFGVALLGVDMVVAADGRLLVVDVNHFSGAPKSVPGFEEALARAVARRAAQQSGS